MSGMDRLTDEALDRVIGMAERYLAYFPCYRSTDSKEAIGMARELLAHRRASQAAAWNDAIEAAASVYLNGSSPNTWDYFSLARHEIRALRRAAPTEDQR